LNEILRIPLIEYAAVFVLAGIFGLGLWVAKWVKNRLPSPPEQAPSA
jgi:hypothetical protein